jgi:hypothetical protein
MSIWNTSNLKVCAIADNQNEDGKTSKCKLAEKNDLTKEEAN